MSALANFLGKNKAKAKGQKPKDPSVVLEAASQQVNQTNAQPEDSTPVQASLLAALAKSSPGVAGVVPHVADAVAGQDWGVVEDGGAVEPKLVAEDTDEILSALRPPQVEQRFLEEEDVGFNTDVGYGGQFDWKQKQQAAKLDAPPPAPAVTEESTGDIPKNAEAPVVEDKETRGGEEKTDEDFIGRLVRGKASKSKVPGGDFEVNLDLKDSEAFPELPMAEVEAAAAAATATAKQPQVLATKSTPSVQKLPKRTKPADIADDLATTTPVQEESPIVDVNKVKVLTVEDLVAGMENLKLAFAITSNVDKIKSRFAKSNPLEIGIVAVENE